MKEKPTIILVKIAQRFHGLMKLSIGDHADDETDHEQGAFIASVSLGAVRDFWIRDKESGKLIMTIPLASGSLFLMGKNFQTKLKHGLPKRKKVKHPRINLTFRRFEKRTK